MPDAKVIYYWDACVLLSYIEGDADRLPIIEAILADCDAGTAGIATSVLSIAEVAFGKAEKDHKALQPEIESKIDQLWQPPSPVILAEVSELVVRDARSLMRTVLEREYSLKCRDAIHLATAGRFGINEFHTYDKGLFKYADMMKFPINAPTTGRLAFPAQPKSEGG